MIISQINSGLGNQMFQYALGRHLSLKHQTQLYLYPYGFENNYALRKFGLDVFHIHGAVIDNGNELEQMKQNAGTNFISDLLYSMKIKGYKKGVLNELAYNFHPAVLKTPDNLYVAGYWQSEKYFKSIEQIIRDDFKFVQAPCASNTAMLKRIQAATAVSVHIRRGDYASHPRVSLSHGVLPIEYYLQAITYIAKKITGIHLFVFSDDIEWARENLHTTCPVDFVNYNNEQKGHEDLRLMAACQHHIIANSSFSWWGAWLNASHKKIVIAPRKWYRDEAKKNPDLIPSGWIQL